MCIKKLKSLFRKADSGSAKVPVDAGHGANTPGKTVPNGCRTAPWPILRGDKIIGVGVPLINKAFYFKDIPENDKEMNWNEAMDYAKKIGRELLPQKELQLCAFFKDEINAIAKEAGYPNFLSRWVWSSTEYGSKFAWNVYFGSGYVYGSSKYHGFTVRPVAAL